MLKIIKEKTGWDVSVITTYPHYRVPDKTRKSYSFEDASGIKIYRVSCPKFEKKNASIRYEIYVQNLLSDFVFMIKAIFKTLFLENFDFVTCSSPPVLTLVAGLFAAIIRKSKLIVDIRDLWIETRVELNMLNSKPLVKILNCIEQITLNKAEAVTCTTKGIKSNIERRLEGKETKVELLTNGIDQIMLNSEKSPRISGSKILNSGKFTILYAGRVGRLQNLSSLIDGISYLERYNFHFIIIGNGNDIESLKNKIKLLKLQNIEILPPKERSELKDCYAHSDALLVHLRNTEALKYTIPSKIFEYMVSEKPIIYGLLGEAKEILDECRAGIWFSPEDVNSFISSAIELHKNYDFYIKQIPYRKKCVIEKYSRENIAIKLLLIFNRLIN